MLMDNGSQKRLLEVISLTMNERINDCPIDEEPHRIKEKKESLKNTLDNRINIPMSSNYKKINKNDLLDYKITDIDLDRMDFIKSKPINVKDNMVDNIKKCSNFKISKDVEFAFEEKQENTESTFNNDVIDNEDLNSLIDELAKLKGDLSSKKEKVRIFRLEVEKTDKIIDDLVLEYGEVEKKLSQLEERNRVLEKDLIARIKKQKEQLGVELSDTEKMVTEFEEKQQQNKNKIIDFREKINALSTQIEQVNNNINNKERIINYLDNKSNSNLEDNDLKIDRKIA